jgi:hypothetical protein
MRRSSTPETCRLESRHGKLKACSTALVLSLLPLAAQNSGTIVTTPVLGRVYDVSAGSLLFFTGTPGTARVRFDGTGMPGGRCVYPAAAAVWLCVSPEGVVSVAASADASPTPLDVPAAPDSVIVSGSGKSVALWYANLNQLYVLTGAGAPLQVFQPAAPVAELLAVSDDGAMVLARGGDGCAWLLESGNMSRCVLCADGEMAAAFGPGAAALVASKSRAEVYLLRAGTYAPEFLAGPGDGIVEPAALLFARGQAFVADRGASAIQVIDPGTGGLRALPSLAPPSQFLPVGGGLYLTTPLASGNLILLETGPAPRLVAAAAESGGGQ